MFGKAIRQRRIQLFITLRDLCKSMDVDPCEWSRIESEIIAPPQSLDFLVALAKYLQADSKYLIDMAEKDEDIVCVPFTDEELVRHLPPLQLFPQGAEMTPEQLNKFVETIRTIGKGVRRHEVCESRQN